MSWPRYVSARKVIDIKEYSVCPAWMNSKENLTSDFRFNMYWIVLSQGSDANCTDATCMNLPDAIPYGEGSIQNV